MSLDFLYRDEFVNFTLEDIWVNICKMHSAFLNMKIFKPEEEKLCEIFKMNTIAYIIPQYSLKVQIQRLFKI